MNLDEYVWRYKINCSDLSKKVGCTKATMSSIKLKKRTPGLLLALKIASSSKGAVDLEEFLSTKDTESLKEWRLEEHLGYHFLDKKPD